MTFDIPDRDPIRQATEAVKESSIAMSDRGFPLFRCLRPVTTEDVKALDDDE